MPSVAALPGVEGAEPGGNMPITQIAEDGRHTTRVYDK